MLLVMDIGNTCITLGVFRDEDLALTARLATDRNRTEDQYAVELHALLRMNELAAQEFDGAIIGSVVPSLNHTLCRAIETVIGIWPMVVGSGVKTGLNIKIDDPATAGSDLVCGAVAAAAKYPLPCVIFDLGTATTTAVVNEKGEFIGGSITAGIGISLDALAGRTSQLPHVSLKKPAKVVGSSTEEAMKSGLIYGTAAMMDGMADRIEQELGRPATLIATGGRAAEVVPYCRRTLILDEHLLLHGLRLIEQKNRKGSRA